MYDKTRKGFTLVEVLIVIGVIGVVAAFTIPTLIPLIKDKIDSNRKEIIEDRLIQGMNQLNTLDDGFNASQYADTEGFVRALSKYYKMSQICGAENLDKCFPYSVLTYTKKYGSEAIKNWTELKTPEDFGLKTDEYYAPAGFISANGTPFVMLLKKDCIMDTGTGMRAIPTSCIQYMYDNNGSNVPNKFNSDLVHSNPLAIGVLPPDGVLNNPIENYNTYLVLGLNYQGGNGTDLGLDTCDDSSDKIWDNRGSKNNYCSNNRWASAKKACAEAGYELPTSAQLQKIYCRAHGSLPNSNYTCDLMITDQTLATKIKEKAKLKGTYWTSTIPGPGSPSSAVRLDFNAVNSLGSNVNSTNLLVICLGQL